ncbi:hypothetical protein Tco_0067405 [Tanacetum coccineum]
MGATSCAPGVALHNAVENKKKKYGSVCEENGYKFIPFAFSTFGEFDMDALDTLSRIKSISISHSNNAKNGVFIFHRKKTNEDRDDVLDNVKTDDEQSHDDVYGCLKGGSENSGGKRLAIFMVEEAWLSEKEEV